MIRPTRNITQENCCTSGTQKKSVRAVFSLFSNRLPDSERQDIARRLNRMPVLSKTFKEGQPRFPVLNHTIKLYDLVGSESWLLFHSLKVNTVWLTQSRCRSGNLIQMTRRQKCSCVNSFNHSFWQFL